MPPSDDLRAELQRRKSNTEKVLELFKSRPGEWIPATVFVDLAGLLAWRTRIADARRIVKAEGGVIENSQVKQADAVGVLYTASKYRYLAHKPLGRPADVPVPDRWPVFDAPSQEPWSLKP